MSRTTRCLVGALVLLLALPAAAEPPRTKRLSVAQKKQIAAKQYSTASRIREALNGRPAEKRTRREYNQAIEAFRRVYHVSPVSANAAPSVVAVGELLAEAGRRFQDPKLSQAAIGQFRFLMREYPGSRDRFGAMLAIAEIYRQDLNDAESARTAFAEVIKKYPGHSVAAAAKKALGDMDAEVRLAQQRKEEAARQKEEARKAAASGAAQRQAAAVQPAAAAPVVPRVTNIRHWSTPDYTRVAIDLEDEVKYEAGRVPQPDRIYFDLHNSRLAAELAGKDFDVGGGFLRKIRAAQFTPEMTRVVLEVDELADYSVFLLPNPYRLIIDVHRGQQIPGTTPAPAPAATGGAATATAVAKAADAEQKDSASPESVEVARREQPQGKGTSQPTSSPTYESIAPRQRTPEKPAAAPATARAAKPGSNGETSLIRALGLKVGRIVVDAGHGGHDTGTIGPKGLTEKEVVLDVSLRLGKLLEERLGAEVIYTREDDTFVPLETRPAIANKAQADLFISVHANSSRDAGARGVETYYLNFTSSPEALQVAARENAVSEKSIFELQDLVKKIALKEKIEESREFAASVQKELYKGVARKVPGARDRGVKKAPFIVLIGAKMPSILAEISFVSNPQDERKLRSPAHRQAIAEALYKGIAGYAGGLSGIRVATREKTSESAGE